MRKLPKDEEFGLKSQLRRAAVSIPTNISEGYGRDSKQELIRYINIAKGSANEIDTLLIICNDLEFISGQEFADMTDKIDHINRMLFNLKDSLQKRTDANRKPQKTPMMLTTKARYAVTAMLDIAVLSTHENKPIKLAEIADRQGIALNYLEQIFAKLKTAGLVIATKGPGGGYVINNGLNHTRVFDIINAVEEQIEITNCGSHNINPCSPEKAKCLTHDLWDGLEAQIKNYLKSITLQDLCKK